MTYRFDFSFLQDTWQEFLHGAWLTLQFTFIALALGMVFGTLLAIGRTGRSQPVRHAIAVYVEVIRNTPLLVQTFWLFFGLASLGVRLSAFTAAIIALTINVSAYSSEIIRAGIESVGEGQIEAAKSLGLKRWQVLATVVLPPALERAFPSLTSQYVLMMLATSIMSQISAEELMAVAGRIQSETFRGFEIYIVAAAIYLVLALLLRFAMRGMALLAFPRLRQRRSAM